MTLIADFFYNNYNPFDSSKEYMVSYATLVGNEFDTFNLFNDLPTSPRYIYYFSQVVALINNCYDSLPYSFDTVIMKIKSIESVAMSDPSLTGTNKFAFLVSSSIARFSFGYWSVNKSYTQFSESIAHIKNGNKKINGLFINPINPLALTDVIGGLLAAVAGGNWFQSAVVGIGTSALAAGNGGGGSMKPCTCGCGILGCNCL